MIWRTDYLNEIVYIRMTLIMKNNYLKFEKTACDLFKLGSYFVHERKMKDDSVLHKTVVYFH